MKMMSQTLFIFCYIWSFATIISRKKMCEVWWF